MLDKLAFGLMFSTTATAVATTAATPSPYAFVVPVLLGCIAALIARGVSMSAPTRRKKTWVYEILITCMSVMLAGGWVYDQKLGYFTAIVSGLGIGALGVGALSLARTSAVNMLTIWAKSWLGSSHPNDPKQ